MFNITSICVDDIIQVIRDNNRTDDLQKLLLIRQAKSINEDEMKWIAKKLADDFCNGSFWEFLENRFEQVIEDRK